MRFFEKLKKYSLYTSITLIKNLILTKLFFPSARLVKFPIDIRNGKNVRIGKGLSTGIFCRIEAYPYDDSKVIISIGNNFKVNDYVHIAAHKRITIGDNVLIASNVFITDLSHGSYGGDEQDAPHTIVDKRELSAKDVIIEDNVWIGQNVVILPGVTIGENSIIGAGSVVTKDIAANSIAVGNPAKVIKQYCLTSKTWDFVK